MAFSPIFQRPFSATFDRRAAAAAATPWWLAGGVSAANAVAVYQPIGAADYAASKVNLAQPGTYNAADGTAYPTHASATGWTFNGSTQYLLSDCPGNLKPVTCLARVAVASGGAYQSILGSRDSTGGIDFQITTNDKASFVKQYVVAIGTANTAVTLGTNYVLGATYSGAGAWVHYRDGSPDGNGTNDQTFDASRTLVIGGIYQVFFSQAFNGSIQSVAIYNSTLTDAQVLAVSTAMAAL